MEDYFRFKWTKFSFLFIFCVTCTLIPLFLFLCSLVQAFLHFPFLFLCNYSNLSSFLFSFGPFLLLLSNCFCFFLFTFFQFCRGSSSSFSSSALSVPTFNRFFLFITFSLFFNHVLAFFHLLHYLSLSISFHYLFLCLIC